MNRSVVWVSLSLFLSLSCSFSIKFLFRLSAEEEEDDDDGVDDGKKNFEFIFRAVCLDKRDYRRKDEKNKCCYPSP